MHSSSLLFLTMLQGSCVCSCTQITARANSLLAQKRKLSLGERIALKNWQGRWASQSEGLPSRGAERYKARLVVAQATGKIISDYSPALSAGLPDDFRNFEPRIPNDDLFPLLGHGKKICVVSGCRWQFRAQGVCELLQLIWADEVWHGHFLSPSKDAPLLMSASFQGKCVSRMQLMQEESIWSRRKAESTSNQVNRKYGELAVAISNQAKGLAKTRVQGPFLQCACQSSPCEPGLRPLHWSNLVALCAAMLYCLNLRVVHLWEWNGFVSIVRFREATRRECFALRRTWSIACKVLLTCCKSCRNWEKWIC